MGRESSVRSTCEVHSGTAEKRRVNDCFVPCFRHFAEDGLQMARSLSSWRPSCSYRYEPPTKGQSAGHAERSHRPNIGASRKASDLGCKEAESKAAAIRAAIQLASRQHDSRDLTKSASDAQASATESRPIQACLSGGDQAEPGLVYGFQRKF